MGRECRLLCGHQRPGCGTIFQLTLEGTFTTLFAFSGTHGAWPGSLIQASNGLLYGPTTSYSNPGTVFRMTLDGTVTILHAFSGPDGDAPPVGLLQASDGYLYGLTWRGGAFGLGTVFGMSLDGETYTVVQRFSGGADGAYAEGPLVIGLDGALYGTTYGGGEGIGFGVVFRLTVP
jgi:uncharacterized repeat protein (TIGR03803 family)